VAVAAVAQMRHGTVAAAGLMMTDSAHDDDAAVFKTESAHMALTIYCDT